VAFKNAFVLLLGFIVVSVLVDWYIINFPADRVDKFFSELPGLIEDGFLNTVADDTVIEMKAGKLRINRENPYCLIINNKTRDGIVFDSEALREVIASGGGGKYDELCHPVVFAGKNYISYLGQDGEYVLEQPSEMLNFSLSKNKLGSMISTYLPQIIAGGKTVYLVLPWVMIPGYVIFLMLKVYWYVFVVRMALKVYKVRGNFNSKELYPMVMFVAAVWYWVKWLIIQVVMNYVGGQRINTNILFFNTILITVGSIFFVQNFSLGRGETIISMPDKEKRKTGESGGEVRVERKLRQAVKEIPLE
jgi:hypothetical protein